ncbi:MAG TPA: BatA and WFA domain-containing protein [Bacteroidia bacterium]|nr:BatA and WFA domain-containing protein [Bacteroidia bacterium]
MKFANPVFLFALFSLAIPIIIHLFNFRKFKKVFFTNVRFLKEVKQDTKARNKIRNLLILACRLLAVLFLVFAFAQPYLPRENGTIRTGDKVISIYVDNSFSMEAVGKNGTLLDEAKKDAKEIAAAYKPTDRFQLLTNDFEGRHQRLVNREEFLELLDEVQPSPAVKNLSEITRRQQDALNTAQGINPGNKQAFIISDFQKTISDFSAIKTDTSIRFHPVPDTAQNRNNIYIDSVWFTSPVRQLNHPEALHIRIKSKSDQDLENVPMRLYVNGEARTPSSFSIAPYSVTDTIIYFTLREPGLEQGLIEINDYPVTFDDKFYFSFNVLKSIPVLAIDPSAQAGMQESTDYLQTLFGNDSTFSFAAYEEDKIDYALFPDYRFIVLNSLKTVSSGLATELRKFVDNGGSLFVFPGPDADLDSYREFLSPLGVNYFEKADTARTVVDQLNYSHPLYQGVFEKQAGNIDLPTVYHHYKISFLSHSTEEELMRLRNGDVFAGSFHSGKGNVYLSSVPLTDSWSNFPRHAIFVPTLMQAALFSQPQNELFYTIGSDDPIDIGDVGVVGENVFHLSDPSKNFDIIPAHSVRDGHTLIDVHRQVKEPGNYFVNLGKDLVTGISFDFNRKESDLTTIDPEKAMTEAGLKNFSMILNANKGLTAALTETDYGIRLWKMCVWLVLLFLLCEALLVRFWKTGTKNLTPQAA